MQITYNNKDNEYIALKATIPETEILVEAGWNLLGKTKKGKLAEPYEHLMDQKAWTALATWRAQRKFMLGASRAVDCTAKLAAPKGEKYLPFQKACIVYGTQLNALLLCDEQRVGKTIESIGIANERFAMARKADPNYVFTILVVCKKSLRIQWKRELMKWLIVKQPVNIITAETGVNTDPVQIVNYEMLFQYHPTLTTTVWDMLIVDEAHYLKNKYSERSQLVLGCETTSTPPIKAKYPLFLTGTPMKNGKPLELWTLVHYLDPVNFDNEHEFKMNYCAPRRGKGGKIKFGEASNLDQLQEELRSTIMIRRLRKEVIAQMPKKTRRVIELPADGCQAAIKAELDAWQQKTVDLVKLRKAVHAAGKIKDRAAYVAAVSALKFGAGFAFSQMSAMRVKTALAKLPMVISHIEEAIEDGSKVVVFGHHVKILGAIKQHFKDAAVLYIGTVKKDLERDAAVQRFKDDPTCTLFIGNEAAQEGLDLSVSNHVIFVELEWVPGDMSQREDRCESVINPQPLLVEHLVLEGSLDATMARRLIKKQERSYSALDRKVKV